MTAQSYSRPRRRSPSLCIRTGCFPPTPSPATSRDGFMRRSPTCRSSARTATPTRPGSPRTGRSPIRRASSSPPTITCSACSTARASRRRRSACRGSTAARSRRTRARSGAASPRTSHLFRGTPSWLWLEPCLHRGVRHRRAAVGRERRPALRHHRRVPRDARIPAARAVRALQHRGARDHRDPARRLRHHREIRASGWKGRVVTAYRPDPVVDPEFAGFAANVAELGEHHRRGHRDVDRLPRALADRRACSSRSAPPPPTTATRPRAPPTSAPPEAEALFDRRRADARRPRRPSSSARRC